MMHYTQSQSGFTLVEVLVAITILLLVIVGPINIITQSNNSSAFATEQTRAFFFAQEGVELAQKLRDDLLLEYFEDDFDGSPGTPPFPTLVSSDDYNACFNGGCGLMMDDEEVDIVDCTSNLANCRLYENDSDERSRFIYGGDAGQETPFTRVITMQADDSSNPASIAVESRVTWRTGSLIASQEVVITSYLFDIYGTN